MNNIKEFETWATECGFDISQWKNGVYKISTTTLIFSMWQEKQREIDALKHKLAIADAGFKAAEHLITNYRSEIDALKAEVAHLRSYPDAFRREESRADKAEREIDALKAEVERLRKDAEWENLFCGSTENFEETK